MLPCQMYFIMFQNELQVLCIGVKTKTNSSRFVFASEAAVQYADYGVYHVLEFAQ